MRKSIDAWRWSDLRYDIAEWIVKAALKVAHVFDPYTHTTTYDLGRESYPLFVDFYKRYLQTLQIDPFYGLVDLRAENPHFFARAEKTHRALNMKED